MLLLTMILVAIIAAFVFGWVLNMIGEDSFNGILEFSGCATMILSCLALVAWIFSIYGWVASSYKADIVNREYGTDYTRQEVYFASDVIDMIREIDRKRIEVNGDLVTGQ